VTNTPRARARRRRHTSEGVDEQTSHHDDRRSGADGGTCSIRSARMGQDLRISDDETLPSGSWYLGAAAGLVPIAAVLALDPQGWFPYTVAKWWAVLVVVLITIG